MEENSKIIRFIKDKRIEIVTFIYLCIIFITGLSLQSLDSLYQGLMKIFTSPGLLISDYMVIGGLGPAIVNASLVGFIGYVVLILNKVPFRATSIAAIFTLVGFGLFGKNIWSVLPIILGVFLYSKLTRQKMITYVYPALFGTALAPFVTQVAFGLGWGVFPGIVIGLIAGFIVPPIASHVLKFHEGYNLYNVGFTAGLVGFLLLSILRAFGFDSEPVSIWGTSFDGFLRSFTLFISISMIVLGYILAKHRIKDYLKIIKHPGTLVTDFTNVAGLGNTLINMGLVGLIGMAYIELTGGNYNGPTLGGIFTMIGFAAFGKHPLNVIPIMLGVWLASLFSIYETTAPGPMLAALFGTALAPIAGQFGPIIGVLAGIIHLFLVSRIGVLHGGLNLYNNGFSAGFVGAIFISVIGGFKKDS